jgi:hypothetical protein
MDLASMSAAGKGALTVPNPWKWRLCAGDGDIGNLGGCAMGGEFLE